MGEDAFDGGPAVMQQPADVDKRGVVRLDTRAMVVGVDLDHHVERVVLGAALVDDRLRGGNGIDQNGQRAASPPQRQHTVELGRRDADRIEHIGEAVCEELLGLLQGRHRDSACARRHLTLRDFDAFRGLHVRAQSHAERRHALLHARDVAHHAGLVDQRGGSCNVGQVHASRPMGSDGFMVIVLRVRVSRVASDIASPEHCRATPPVVGAHF